MRCLLNRSHSFVEYIFDVLFLFGRTFDQCVRFDFVLQFLRFRVGDKFLRIGYTQITFGTCKDTHRNNHMSFQMNTHILASQGLKMKKLWAIQWQNENASFHF